MLDLDDANKTAARLDTVLTRMQRRCPDGTHISEDLVEQTMRDIKAQRLDQANKRLAAFEGVLDLYDSADKKQAEAAQGLREEAHRRHPEKRPIVKIMLLCEMEVSSAESAEQEIQEALDKFREETHPATTYGLTIYRMTADDLLSMTNATGAQLGAGSFLAPFLYFPLNFPLKKEAAGE